MDFMHLYRHPARLYILAFNIIAMIASVGLAAVGILGLSSSSWVLLNSDMISWFLIILSLFIFLVSLLGCAAALAESRTILGTLSLIIYALTQHDNVDSLLDQAWDKAYEHNPRMLQDIETRLQCCGYASVGDRAIPKTSPFACRESPAFGYRSSCQQQLKQSYFRHENALLSFVIGIQFLQILALTATVTLWSQLPSGEEVEDRYRTEHSQRLLRGLQAEDQEQRRYRGTTVIQGDGQGTGGGSDGLYGSTGRIR
ncbi:hypothetical protein EDD11_002012 [Mortierella claussenii]|nr:hypothetical protein EDD11_002012 [Mortierella claussenii]